MMAKALGGGKNEEKLVEIFHRIRFDLPMDDLFPPKGGKKPGPAAGGKAGKTAADSPKTSGAGAGEKAVETPENSEESRLIVANPGGKSEGEVEKAETEGIRELMKAGQDMVAGRSGATCRRAGRRAQGGGNRSV